MFIVLFSFYWMFILSFSFASSKHFLKVLGCLLSYLLFFCKFQTFIESCWMFIVIFAFSFATSSSTYFLKVFSRICLLFARKQSHIIEKVIVSMCLFSYLPGIIFGVKPFTELLLYPLLCLENGIFCLSNGTKPRQCKMK